MQFTGIDKSKKALKTRVISPADLAVYAREHGYDGAVIKNVFDGDVMGDDVIVYESSQIKSATDNIGTFDSNNPDIRFSISPQMAERDKMAKEEIVALGNELNTSGAGYVSDEGEIRFSLGQCKITMEKNAIPIRLSSGWWFG